MLNEYDQAEAEFERIKDIARQSAAKAKEHGATYAVKIGDQVFVNRGVIAGESKSIASSAMFNALLLEEIPKETLLEYIINISLVLTAHSQVAEELAEVVNV